MDPITIAILWAIKTFVIGSAATGAVAAAIYIASLTMPMLKGWFSQRKNTIDYNSDYVAATFKKEFTNGNYKLVQGVFNKRTKTMVDSRSIEANQIDAEIMSRHRNSDVVLYASYEY